jgi:response regulator RpfG family c-di-GMP phosphodiesterase
MNPLPKILYLDDEEQNLIAFHALFRREYDIFTTTSPQEAVAYLNQHEVQVILSDQKMPDISGVEFFEMIIPEFPRAIRILITGYADIEAVISAINRGEIFRYVAKPWDENDLRHCLQTAVQKYENSAPANSLLKSFDNRIKAIGRVNDVLTRESLESLGLIGVFLFDTNRFAELSTKDGVTCLRLIDCHSQTAMANEIIQFAYKGLQGSGKNPNWEDLEGDALLFFDN